ncbi:MAG: DNA-binding domain-containing protein [Alphaproteobacteria bacterium]|nr:DNA-binding domain-containing protein [Alphaproteobacteria bacterium]
MTTQAPGSFEGDMARAVLSADRTAAPGWMDAESAFRFRVYRNNLRHGLAGLLADAFPVVRRLVGAEFFEAAAAVFVERHPPEDRMLAAFGGGFPEFLDSFEPARSVPYLGDVARLERARIEALHAADAAPLDPVSVSALGERVVSARFVPHPACRLLRSPHPVLSIWQANVRAEAASSAFRGEPEAVLITRPVLEVHVVALSEADAAFADALLQGHSADEANGIAVALDPCFEPMRAFRTLLDSGAFRGLQNASTFQTKSKQGSGS